MTSPLLPSTRALLSRVRACDPLFPNIIAVELFEAEHTRGDLKILPMTTGGYIVHDLKARNGAGTVDGPFPKVEQAHEALERHAKARKADHEREQPKAGREASGASRSEDKRAAE